MFCRHCGAEIPGDSVFCKSCGKSLKEKKSVVQDKPAKNPKPGPPVTKERIEKQKTLLLAAVISFMIAFIGLGIAYLFLR